MNKPSMIFNSLLKLPSFELSDPYKMDSYIMKFHYHIWKFMKTESFQRSSKKCSELFILFCYRYLFKDNKKS